MARRCLLQYGAAADIELDVNAGEVGTFVRNNGVGNSTLVKVLASVHQLSAGTITFDGWRVMLTDPATALDPGIATVFPDLAPGEILDLVTNIFLGRELGRYENTRQRSAVCSIPSRWRSLDFDRVPTASEQ